MSNTQAMSCTDYVGGLSSLIAIKQSDWSAAFVIYPYCNAGATIQIEVLLRRKTR